MARVVAVLLALVLVPGASLARTAFRCRADAEVRSVCCCPAPASDRAGIPPCPGVKTPSCCEELRADGLAGEAAAPRLVDLLRSHLLTGSAVRLQPVRCSPRSAEGEGGPPGGLPDLRLRTCSLLI